MALIESSRDGRPLYRVRWNYTRDPATGKRKHQERSFRKKRDAIEFDRRVNGGTTQRSERLTVAGMMDEWRAAHSDTWQLRTRKDNEQQDRIRIRPFLGSKRVTSITPAALADWVDWMRAEGHGPRSITKSLQTLKTANRWARSRGLSQNTSIDDARGPSTPPPKPARPLTPTQIDAIARACELHRDAALMTVAAYSGLRWSELRGLQWQDYDPDTNVLTVQRSIDRDLSVKAPKSGKARSVPLLTPGVTAIREWHAACTRTGPTDWIFPAANGKPLFARWYADTLYPLRIASGIHFDPHELRDTYASILIAAGVGEAELTLWLGHSSVEITVRRYGQLFAARQLTMAEKANAIIGTLG